MAKFAPPSDFDFTTPELWPQWKTRFARFRTATKLSSESDECQVSTLLYALGPAADAVYDNELVFADAADRQKFDEVLKAFDTYFTPAENIIHERTVFARLRQKPGEAIAVFSSRLHEQAIKCHFDKQSEHIRDHLIAHMTNNDVGRELQKMDFSNLTLAEVLKQAKAAETLEAQFADQCPAVATAGQSGSRTHSRDRAAHPNKAASSRPTGAPPTSRSSARAPESHLRTCPGCGSRTSHTRRACPAWDVECHQCGKRGHFAKVCKSGKGSKSKPQHVSSAEHVHETAKQTPNSSADPSSDSPLFMGSATSDFVSDTTAPWTVPLSINGSSPIMFKLDSGADRTLIRTTDFQSLSPTPVLTPVSTQLRGPDGNLLHIHGQFEATTSWEGRQVSFNAMAVDGPSNLLSRSVCSDLHLLSCSVSSATAPAPLIGKMSGPPATIELVPDARPYHCHTARRVPVHLHAKVKAELQRMEDMGVISRVTEPTDWCAPMVPVVKPNGSVRICVDLKKLNQSVKRAHFPLPTIDDSLARLSGAQYFSALDTASGFWQVPLSPECAPLTTFITPFGRFQFHRLPFGITSAPEIFQERLLQIVGHIPNVVVYMDDILVFGSDVEEHDATLKAVEDALSASGVLLNPAKSKLRQSSLTFLGHVVSRDGIRPDPKKLSAISALPTPTDVASLRRALGMFTFLTKFLPDMANISAPLRELLKADSHWTWEDAQERAFTQLKTLASTAPCLSLFDLAKPVRISADASSYGLGAVLLQPVGSTWRPVAFASRSLQPAEQRYAQIEKECLAIVWACEHFHQHIYGGPNITVETDHKPLVPLVNSMDLDRAPLRCQRLLLRLMRYNVTAVHVPGKSLVIADTLSRAPVPDSSSNSDITADVDAYVMAATASDDPHLNDIRSATASDPDMVKLLEYTRDGWPRKQSLVPAALQPYFALRFQLSFHDGLLYRDNRVIVPAGMQAKVLSQIHEGHQGVMKCRARARQSVWWPGLSTAIETFVQNCHTCAEARRNPSEPLQSTPFPEFPWDKVACDLCEVNGKSYLVVVDYFSRYIEVAQLTSTTSAKVISTLDGFFSSHGIPRELVSDNGPQFSSPLFRSFAEDLGFRHRTSSPRFPQSNGEAERAVQTAKQLITKNSDLNAALRAYRTTPLSNGYSPSQLLFGRQIRTSLAATPQPPSWPNLDALRAKEVAARQQQADRFNSRHRARELPPLPKQAPVFIPDLGKTGHIEKQLSARSYSIKTNRSTVQRNRHHLRALPTQTKSPAEAPVQQSQPAYYEVEYGTPSQTINMPPSPPSPAEHNFPPLQLPAQSPRQDRPRPPNRRPTRTCRMPARYVAEE